MATYDALREEHVAEFRALISEHLERIVWPVERIRTERQRRLRTLLATAQEGSSWHRERLADIDPDTATEDDLRRISPMTKNDMMENLDGIFTDPTLSHRLVEAHLETLFTDAYLLDKYHVFASGGSSGRRGIFVWDWNGWLWFSLTLSRFSIWQNIQAGLGPDTIEAAVAADKASHMTGAGTFQRPTVHRFPATLSLQEIVAGLNRLQPAILRGYPTALAALAAEAKAGRLRVAPVAVRTHSEPLLPEMRRAIEDAWGRPVSNGYGTTEGASATSCGKGHGMHLNEDLCIFEVVDEVGRPVPPGERCAKVYITNLMNLAQPLIRYELNDELVLIDEPCACGSALRRVSDIEGRVDDAFSYPGGIIVHPLIFRSPLSRERNIIEYQVRQSIRGATIRVRTSGTVDFRSLTQRITGGLVQAGIIDPEVAIEPVEAFNRLASGKLKRFFPLPPA